MHRKMGQNIQFLFPRQSIEDARRLCTDFMKGTMHILGAKVIREPEPESKTRSMRYLDFLYNTPTENNINRRIHEMLKDAAKRVLLVGWVDREFIGDISNAKKRGVEVRIVTKSRTGR